MASHEGAGAGMQTRNEALERQLAAAIEHIRSLSSTVKTLEGALASANRALPR